MTERERPVDSRRAFLRRGATLTGLALAGPFQALAARAEASGSDAGRRGPSPDYGLLYPTADETTGLPLLMLPQGFRYVSFGWTGDALADGTPTPGAPDGMAALSGTIRNCAGGPTPWGSWISCEETLEQPGAQNNLTKVHGYAFEVPAVERAVPEPIWDMGRFAHEAVAVDPATGYVYETEDQGSNCSRVSRGRWSGWTSRSRTRPTPWPTASSARASRRAGRASPAWKARGTATS